MTQADMNSNSTLEHPNPSLNDPISLSKPLTSKRNIRGKKFRTPKDMYQHYCSSGHKECKMMRNRNELLAHLRTYHGINLDQPNSLQSIPLTLDSETLTSQQQQSSDEELALQCNEESSLQSSSQHLECRIDEKKKFDNEMELIESSLKKWTWNEVEKCWELMKNGQIDGDEGNDEVGEQRDNEGSEVKDMDEDDQLVGNDEELLMDDEDSDGELNGREHVKNLDGAEAQKHQMARSIPSSISESSSQHLVREGRIDDAEEKVDTEMESIESSMKRWTWNEVEKCWELRKNGQIDGDEGNDEVGEECDDENSEDGVELNIDSAEAKVNRRPDNQQQTLQNDQHGNDQLNELEHRENIEGAGRKVVMPGKSTTGKHVCEHCGKGFLYPTFLTRHTRTHTGERPFTCPWKDCPKTFAQKGHMQVHLESHYDKSLTRKNICELCGRGFRKRYELKCHIRTHTGDFQHFCEFCFRGFRNRYDLNCHIRTHTGDKPYVCAWEDCGKAFNQSHHLKYHMCTHTGDKPYVCAWEDCGKAFNQSHHLKYHMCTHTGDKPYQCPDCKKTFIQRSQMLLHLKQHTGDFPHFCEHCGKGFTLPSILKRHIRTHTAVQANDPTNVHRKNAQRHLLINQ